MLSIGLLVAFLAAPGVSFAFKLQVARGDSSYTPQEIVQGDKLYGLHIDMLRMVALRLGWDIEFIPVPFRRALQQLQRGNVDAASFVSKTKENEDFAVFDDRNILSVVVNVLFKNKSRDGLKFTGDFGQLKGKQLVGLRGYYYGEIDTVQGIDWKYLNDLNQIAGYILKERGDFGVGSLSGIQYSVESANLAKLHLFREYPVGVDELFIAFSKARNLGGKIEEFSQAMAAFKQTPEYAALVRRYGNPSIGG